MHESRVVADLVARIEAVARDAGIERVGIVTLELGPESHVTSDSVEGLFEVLAAGTPAEGATIVVSDIPHDRPDAPDGIVLVSITPSA